MGEGLDILGASAQGVESVSAGVKARPSEEDPMSQPPHQPHQEPAYAPETEGADEAQALGSRFWALAATLALGVLLSLYLSWVHLEVRYFGTASLCDLTDKINCSVAAGSAYAEVLGVPNAIIGLAFYVAGLVTLVRWRFVRDDWGRPLLVLGFGLACIYSLFLAGVLALKLGTLCPACTALYGVNIAGLVLSRMVAQEGYGDSLRRFSERFLELGGSTTVAVYIMALFGVATAGHFGLSALGEALGGAAKETPGMADAWVQESYVAAPVADEAAFEALWEGGAHEGAKQPLVRIVELSDFECPFCGKLAPSVQGVVKAFPKEVGVVFRHNPLDQACNPKVKKKFHDTACGAAYAGVCAEKEGKFWEMHDKMFENSTALTGPNLVKWAGELGMDGSSFEACMGSPETKARVEADLKLGSDVGLKGTPLLVINGRLVSGAVSEERLKAVVRYEIRRAQGFGG